MSWHTDVLVIGGGLAGLTAAIAARKKKDCDVLVIGKGKEGRISATVLSGGGFMAASNNLSAEEHFQRTWEGGGEIADPQLIKTLVSDIPKGLVFFEVITGLKFTSDRPGSYRLEGSSALKPPIGMHLLKPLREAARRAGIRIIGEFSVTELLVQNERCVGARGLYQDQLIDIQAQAVILATGGCAGLFSHTDNPMSIAGEGYALAKRAGATIRDMEFIQFHALGLDEQALPRVILTNPFPPSLSLIDTNRQDLISAWFGPEATLEKASKLYRDDLTRRLINLEGGAFLDFSQVAEPDWQSYSLFRRLRRCKFDFSQQPVRVHPVAHYCMGGVGIDSNGHTAVKGLWAAGEVAGGIDGANRLAGNALAECLVFGIRAGESAASSISKKTIATRREKPRSTRTGQLYEDAYLTNVERQLRTGCWQYLGPIRTREGLIYCQTKLHKMWENADMLEFENDRQEAMVAQLKLRLECALAITEAALQRKESLGAHYRVD